MNIITRKKCPLGKNGEHKYLIPLACWTYKNTLLKMIYMIKSVLFTYSRKYPVTSRCVCSPLGARTTRLGVVDRMSRRSRRNAPKKGTTRHSGIARARPSARSYSTDKRAVDKNSSTGSDSFSVMDSQKGFNLLDLLKQYIFLVNV